jgi:hypothetical protein
VLIDVQIALGAVGGSGERTGPKRLYTYRAATKEESLINHGFTILQPISEALYESATIRMTKIGNSKNCM